MAKRKDPLGPVEDLPEMTLRVSPGVTAGPEAVRLPHIETAPTHEPSAPTARVNASFPDAPPDSRDPRLLDLLPNTGVLVIPSLDDDEEALQGMEALEASLQRQVHRNPF